MFETAMLLDGLDNLVKVCHQNSKDKGFWTGPDNDNAPTKMMLMVSEIAEMLEAYRKGNPPCDKEVTLHGGEYEGKKSPIQILESTGYRTITSMEEEIADLFIRLCDYCGRYEIDLGRVTLAKMAYNAQRSYMHGGKKV
jgi:NTP pyrophosphatase (non-canonical NTP hydrolase)